MVAGAGSQKKMFWLLVGLIASARSQPVTDAALQEGTNRADTHLQELGTDSSQVFGHMKTLASSLEHVFRHGRELQELVGDETGRQTAATLATSLGSLIIPAITAFIGALTMNGATSTTNAVTASLGGRTLDVIPAEAFMTAPSSRESPVQQPTRKYAEEVLKRRPSRRKQMFPASAIYGIAQ